MNGTPALPASSPGALRSVRLLGTLSLLPQTLERYRLQVDDQFDEAMRDTEIAEVKQAMDAVRAETAALDKSVMLPKLDTSPASSSETTAPATATPAATASPAQPPATKAAEPKPKPRRKKTATKSETSDAGQGKTKPKGGS